MVNLNRIENIRDYYFLYLNSVCESVPIWFYVFLIGVMVFTMTLLFLIFGVKNVVKTFIIIVLLEYLVFIICSAVFFRDLVEVRDYCLIPFWSYHASSEDLQNSLYIEKMMNVLMFVPIGFLMGGAFGHKIWKKVLVFAVSLSFLIETLQYMLKRGFSELDDVFHNTLGAMIGFGLIVGILAVGKVLLNQHKKK